MNACCFINFGAIIICSLGTLSLAKPYLGEDKNFGEENLRCTDSSEGSDFEKSQNSFNDFYNKPRPRLEGMDKFSNKPSYGLTEEKRSVGSGETLLQKRQVGVVYQEDKPIGILQPYQRSYRFIPIKEGIEEQEAEYNLHSSNLDKRDVNRFKTHSILEESYPSILTNFKIGSKLDKKRNYDSITDEDVQELKTTIRRLRSSNSGNTEKIEEKLKNILDDMGLIDDEEVHPDKREVVEEEKYEDEEEDQSLRDKRNENEMEAKKSLTKNEISKKESNDELTRKKRQKQETPSKQSADLIEDLKDSGDLMVSGNKSPLASTSEIIARDAGNDKVSEVLSSDDDEYEKRVERQIQSKINSLKEEVKREIESLKKKQTDEDTQRKKRQVVENLMEEETAELNPTLNIDHKLKPLVRKRRSTEDTLFSNNTKSHRRKKREADMSFGDQKVKRSPHTQDIRSNEKNYNQNREETEEGGELLGDELNEGSVAKREVYRDRDYGDGLFQRRKRSRILLNPEIYDSYLYNGNDFYDDENERAKRQNVDDDLDFADKFRSNRYSSMRRPFRLKSRIRRTLNEGQGDGRPQQLSDMSDLDLFGALPKSYSGELSRYKRVKK